VDSHDLDGIAGKLETAAPAGRPDNPDVEFADFAALLCHGAILLSLCRTIIYTASHSRGIGMIYARSMVR
jgi:hypothetical protein